MTYEALQRERSQEEEPGEGRSRGGRGPFFIKSDLCLSLDWAEMQKHFIRKTKFFAKQNVPVPVSNIQEP